MSTVPTRFQPIGAPGDLIDGVEFGAGQARQIGRKGQPRGGVVDSVDQGSPAYRAGIREGDVVLRVNGKRIRDVIDYQFFTADDGPLELEIVPAGEPAPRTVHAPRVGAEPTGIGFTEPTFTPIRECNNHCPFCFIDQLPGHMRNSLYIRDDDYRYSFLFGNFVTLTNLNERDWARLEEQRLSPLYVSVHATDLPTRRLLLGNERAPDIMEQLERLFSLGIRVHTQVVTCPGLNDGAILERTVDDLASHFPNVLSIGVVPVGLTRTPREILSGPGASCSRLLPSAADLPLRQFLPDEARAVVRQNRRWQHRFRKQYGVSVVYASDEFYLLCREPVPSAASYDGYPQYENGIGMVRDLIDDWKRTKQRLLKHGERRPLQVSLVCGEMIAHCLDDLVRDWADVTGADARLHVIRNDFFGPRVRVSGLLSGGDIVAQAGGFEGDLIILPAVMLDKTGTRTLDNMTPAEISAAVGKPVAFAGYLSEVDAVVAEALQGGRIAS